MKRNPIPPDVDDAIYEALKNTVGCELAFAATEVVCQVLASRRDALRDMLAPLPERRPLVEILRGHDA